MFGRGARARDLTGRDTIVAKIWKGALTFGLVNIPVHLEPAVKSDEGRVSFRQLREGDLSPIKNERIAERDGQPVAWDEIVKGYEYEKGKFVVLTKEELDAVEVASSRTIDVLDFVEAAAIDPRYFEKPYYLLPEQGAEKAYALLREAIRQTGMVGIGKITMRQRQHLVAIKTLDEALILEIMRFEDEIVDDSTYTFPAADKVRPQELAMAEQLVRNLADNFDPSKYTDEYRDNLMTLIQAKIKGETARLPEQPELEGTKVIDLMARLQQSLEHQQRVGKKTPARAKKSEPADDAAASDESGKRARKGAARKTSGPRKRRSA